LEPITKTLAMILAGGEGRRLEPLTRDRAKPAVPFGGRYRIVDFALSNFANSGVLKMKVLTQYKSDSLNRHVSRGWRLSAFLGQYVEVVPAQMRRGPEWFKGSADAIYQNLNLITDEDPDHVFVFGADHVYRMDVNQLLEFHLSCRADCTVAAIPVPIEQAHAFGVIAVDAEGRMVGFEEKPKHPRPMPQDPTRALASMGNYLFRTSALIHEIEMDAGREGAHDFGKDVITEMWKRSRVFVYDFNANVVPGQAERERGYWRDVGTVDAYYQANMDLIEVDPIFSLYNDRWPIFTEQQNSPPVKFVFADREGGRVGSATDSLISEGCIISGGELHRCILSPRVRINSYCHIEDSILFEGVKIGRYCRIRRAIIDKNVELPAGLTIGYNPEQDRRRFHVTEGGVVVIPKGMKVEQATP
jgi:glucose-1-phosphate adenylyltransferase